SPSLQVSMMSDSNGAGGAEIKKEEVLKWDHASPANSMYSPSTTAIPEMEYKCEPSPSPQSLLYGSPISPGSPDRHFCSSTTQPLGDNPYSIDGLNKEDEAPKRLCLVCGDIASGFHYGVASCEACKAFFKRTIQGNIEYTCPASNDCEINKRRRKACQACRFQKCLRMGMLKEGVRLDRVRGGRQKYRRNNEVPFPITALLARRPSLEGNKMLGCLQSCEPEPLLALTDPSTLDSDYGLVSTLSDLVDKELVLTISWAKQIPGFSDLPLNDQMHLLQCGWAEVLGVATAFRSLPTSGQALVFASDFHITEKQARLCGAQDLYFQCMNVVSRFQGVGISREEYLLLKALVLANAEVGSVEDSLPLTRLRENISASLSDCIIALRPEDAMHHLGKLLMSLPVIRQVDDAMRRFWGAVRRSGRIPMNKLFVEMLEPGVR
ncbi:unnamed protein product, partial [Darwinula stevensoni]